METILKMVQAFFTLGTLFFLIYTLLIQRRYMKKLERYHRIKMNQIRNRQLSSQNQKKEIKENNTPDESDVLSNTENINLIKYTYFD